MDRRKFLLDCSRISAGTAAVSTCLRGGPAPKDAWKGDQVHGAADPWIEIDLENMRFNLAQLRRKTGGRPILAVIKCNAYGHGLQGVGRFLDKEEGVYGMAVGKLAEAAALREAGVRRPLLNFGPFLEEDAGAVLHYGIAPSIFTDAVEALDERARRAGKTASVHIKIDTGLGRVGVPFHRADAFLDKVARLKNIRIEGIFQSFSEEKAFDAVQLKRFLKVVEQARGRGIDVGLRHAASSTAVFSYDQPYFLDMIRPGIAIYGHYPTDEEFERKRMVLKPVLSLKTRISCAKILQPGEAVSYFRKFTAERPEPVATLPLGYSDGVPLNLAGNARVLINGRSCPLFADLTANHSYARLGPEGSARVGDEAVVIGRQNDEVIELWDLYRSTGVAPYKLLINLNPGLKRVFRG